jgi:contact-dependent growth inhibition (CDI) system CdiI-like immunity protein
MTLPLDRTKPLNQLDPPAWGEPEYNSSLVRRCHRLRDKPIGDFTIDDLRVMIGQGIGLRYLVPLALEVLEHDPLAEGDYYPGDLLESVLGVDPELWTRESEWRDRIRAVLKRLPEVPRELKEAEARFRVATA